MLEISHLVDTRQAYDEIYHDSGILLRDSFYLWLVGLLKPKPRGILLDISCGQGRLLNLAQQYHLRLMGIDFAMEGVRKGITETPQADWLVGDGEKIPLADQSIDYITHIGSLEHYLHPEHGASEIARLLKSDGLACILLPNAYGLLGNIKHVWLKGDIFDDGQPLQRYATYQSWANLLQNGGLKIQKTVGYNEIERPLTKRDWQWLLTRPQKMIRLGLSGLIPLNLTNHFVFLCTRGK
jgi:SAM-dependent methyltransferase